MTSNDRPGWYLISLRPQGEHAALRAAVARRGGRLLALSPWRLRPREDNTARTSLRTALRCERIVFTSPAAVRFAARMATLRQRRGQAWIATGDGTAAALSRAGIATVLTPERMDSEGLLALPQLRQVRGIGIGLVTAPGGRGLLASALQRRGADLHRADVYERTPLPLSPRAMNTLSAGSRGCLALSSGEALATLLAQLPEATRKSLLNMPVVAASTRLASLAKATGFANVHLAAGPRPAQLAQAAAQVMAMLVH